MTRKRLYPTILCGLVVLGVGCTSSDNPADPGPTTGTIAGTISDAMTGQSIAGATVVTSPATSTVTTNGEGSYTIADVSTGAYTVTASHAGYSSNSTSALAVAATTVTANLALSPATGSIAGVVTDASSGLPIPGASVTTQPPTSSVITNAQGAYTITNVVPGSYTVSASRSGYATATAAITATPGNAVQADIALAGLPGTLTGSVTDAVSGAPLVGATVTTQPPTSTATTNALGVWTLNLVSPGPYTVSAVHAGHSPGSVATTVLPGQTATANLALAPIPGAIGGTVTSAADGTPLAGATVSIALPTSIGPADVLGAIVSVTTNGQGVYTISNVPPGTWTVTATIAGYEPGTVQATVSSSQTATRDIALSPLAGAITGVVTDGSNGLPVSGASILTTPATIVATTNSQGVFTISNVPPGNYTVTATKPGYGNASGPATVLPGQQATRNLTMNAQPAYDGTWSGTTSDGKTIGFTIVNNAFTSFTLSYNAVACGLSGSVTITFTTPQQISGNSFTVSSPGGPPVRVAFSAPGTFTSANMSSGTVVLTVTLSFPFTPCSTNYSVSWTATR